MADKILGGIGLPVVVTLGTYAKLTSTPDVPAPKAEVGVASDFPMLMFRQSDQGVFVPVTEYWRGDQTTDTAPTNSQTMYKVTLQELGSAPSNAFYINFIDPSTGVGSNKYLVLEDA